MKRTPPPTIFKICSFRSGQAMIASVIFLVLLSTVIIAGFATPLTRELKLVRTALNSRQSYFAAESGVEDAIYRIKNNLDYDASYNLNIGDTSVAVAIIEVGNDWTINVTGDAYNHRRALSIQLDLSEVGVDLFYGIQVGEGGLLMGNGSEVAGNVYSNGDVICTGGTCTVTGGVTVASDISLADENIFYNNDQIVGKTDPEIDLAQSFRASDSKPLAKVSLYLKKVGNPSDRTVEIVNDVAGSPGTIALASGTLDANLVTTSYGWIDIVFSNPANLTNNNTYWIILDATQNNSKYWIWGKDNNNGYGNGQGKFKDNWLTGGGWTTISGDLDFKIYLGIGFSVLTKMAVYGDVRANSITDSKICGDAYYQIIDSFSTNFLNNPVNPCPLPHTSGTGQVVTSDPPVAPLPISQGNVDEWKAAALVGGICIEPICEEDGDYTLGGGNELQTASIGPIKIAGDLTLENNSELVVTGTIWVAGDIKFSQGSTVQLDVGYGENSGVIVGDSIITVKNGSSFYGSGDLKSYVLVLSDKDIPTGIVIDVGNNSSGVVYYAGKGRVKFKQGAFAKEATAYGVDLEENAHIQYETGLADLNFTSGPGGAFAIISWQEVE